MHNGDGFLGKGGSGALQGFGTEVKLVACAVFEVVQSYAAVIGREVQLLEHTQIVAVIHCNGKMDGVVFLSPMIFHIFMNFSMCVFPKLSKEAFVWCVDTNFVYVLELFKQNTCDSVPV